MKLIPLSLAVLVCYFVSALTQSASAEDANGKKRWVTIPVMYVTDRNSKKGKYGAQRKFETIETIDDLHCGWLDYSLKANREITDQQKQLGWSESQSSPDKTLVTKELDSVKNYHDFGPVIIEAAKKSAANHVFVMVHGFNTPFTTAAEGAARLAQQVQCPVILYSWPSKGKLGQYNVDLGNNEWSQEHFDALLEELKAAKDASGMKFTLVAHSMGNRLVVRSAPVLQGKRLFKDMFLVDPDFDAETFVHYLVRYGRKKDLTASAIADVEATEPTRVRILFSHKDHALPLSSFLSGGYTRLGQVADNLLTTVVAPYTIPGKISDALGSNTSRDVTDRINSQASTWLMNFQWIDYTVLDHGVIGHTVPFEMIGSLASTNLPGDGLKLVHSDNGAPNKLSRFFTHMFSEGGHISSKIDSCEKVVVTTGK